MLDWNQIDTVLLDMDGTLIDKYLEDNFWENMIPREYAKKYKITIKEAKSVLFPKFKSKQGTADYGNADYWANELDLNIWSIRERALKKAALHPHTLNFLKFLKKRNKKIYLVTASYPKDTKIKLIATKMSKYFDGIYTEHDIGKTKYENEFWERLRRDIGYNNERTLLAEDDANVIRTAMKNGIKWLVFKMKYNSRRAPQSPNDFICVHHFDELIRFK